MGLLRRVLGGLLTLHRHGGISLKTTNLLESIHARVEARVPKVDH